MSFQATEQLSIDNGSTRGKAMTQPGEADNVPIS